MVDARIEAGGGTCMMYKETKLVEMPVHGGWINIDGVSMFVDQVHITDKQVVVKCFQACRTAEESAYLASKGWVRGVTAVVTAEGAIT